MSGSRLYDKMLEKATSPLLLDVDWESILRMCDLVRQEDVQTKYALNQLKKKLNSDNIHVLSYSLNCLESLVKNCGSKVHQEVATKEFMDIMRNMAGTKSDPVKSKVLELIQCWSHAFKKNPNYRIVEDYFNAMKLEGFSFQPLKESEAMFDVEEAPAWKEDSECTSCFRCRTEFSTLRRRHHCRACGQIFCHACSSKTSPIPKFGIEKEVRVCDVCYEKLRGNTLSQSASSSSSGTAGNEEQLPIEYIMSPLYKEATSAANNPKKPAEKTEQEFQDELNLALALSQSEAEAKENSKRSSSLKKTNSTSSKKKDKSSTSSMNKNWNDQPSNASAPYADSPPLTSQIQNNNKGLSRNSFILENSNANIHTSDDKLQSTYNDEEIRINIEIDEFVEELKKLLELYLNRMKSDSMRGRSITNDTAVQSLFLQLQHLHPKLLSYIKYQEDARGYYENLQDKLTQLKDAREALNALRHENFEKKKRELEEKERLRQLQISHKLQLMRQQKQSYYLYQNQLNLQRLQEQERDLQLRLSQQRELVSKRDQSIFSNGLSFKPSNGLNDSYGNSNSIPDMSAMMMNSNQMQYSMPHNLQQPNLANNLNNYQQQAFLANQYGVNGVGMTMNTPLQGTGMPAAQDQMNNGLPMLDSKLQSLQLQQMQQQQSVMMQQQLPTQTSQQPQQQQQPMMVGAYQQWQQNIQQPAPQQQQQQQQQQQLPPQSQAPIQQQPQQNIQYQQYPQQQHISNQMSSNVVQGNDEPLNIPKEAPLISFD